MKKIFMMLLFAVIVFLCVACDKEEVQESQVSDSSKQQLQIFKTDMNLSQEQVLSQIKAERLIENNGYLDNDEVVVMVNSNVFLIKLLHLPVSSQILSFKL